MTPDGKDWTILGIIVGWVITLIAYAKDRGDTNARVTDIEELLEKSPLVTCAQCRERMTSCKENQALQFAAGAREFAEIKQLISDMNKSYLNRHDEIVSILLDMKGHKN